MSFLPASIKADDAPAPKPKVIGWAEKRVEEKLDRAMIAIAQDKGKVYLGWRLLKTDPENVAFNVYRSTAGGEAVKLNAQPLGTTTDFVDAAAPLDRENAWWVRPVVDGRELEPADRATLPPNPPVRQYISIKLQGDYTINKVGIGDLDGDGKYDFVVKQPGSSVDPGSTWRPSPDTYKIEAYKSDGTFLWRKDLGWSIEMGVWYSPFIVFDLDGDGKAEVAVKTGEGDPRDSQGHVLTGPEYCSIWNGQTGEEIDRVDWIARGKSSDWGDEKNNRASRHQIGVAYLDGKTPCLLVVRGQYTIMRVDAFQYHDKKLQQVWSWCGDEEQPPFRGQGAHTLHAADVDGDGRDEVLLGSCAVDDNGQGLWSTGFGHPDRFFVTDVDPSRPGLEVLYCIEPRRQQNGVCLVEARSGKVIWGTEHLTEHISHCLCADIDAHIPGMECWATTVEGTKTPKDPAILNAPMRWLFSSAGKLLAVDDQIPPLDGLVWWDADSLRELESKQEVSKWHGPVLTKGIEGKVLAWADILGDWREEIITSLPGELRIYTTVIPADQRRVCLMQDPIYRLDVALAAMGYLQPPMTSFFLGVDAANSPNSLSVEKLRCDLADNPLGVDSPHPRLSWILQSEQNGQCQTAYQILAASSLELLASDHADLWDSGRVESDETIHIPYAGQALKSSQQVFWKVRVWDKDNKPSAWSEPAQWTMGLLSDADWQARWIAADADCQSLLLRREFTVKSGLKRTVAHVCGLGYYEMTINGRKAGYDLLTPGWTKYDKTCLYDTRDITRLLKEGRNAVGLLLGNGMYNVTGGRYVKFKGSYGPLKAIAHLRLEYDDGAVEIIGADDYWRTHPGPITFSCVFGGEDYDACLELPAWDQPDFDDQNWTAAKVVDGPGGKLRGHSCAAPPIRANETLQPVSVKQLKPGVALYDLGQNASIMPRLTVKGPAGSSIKIIPAELLKKDGTVDRTSCATARDRPIGNTRCRVTPRKAGFPSFSTTAAAISRSNVSRPRPKENCPRFSRLPAWWCIPTPSQSASSNVPASCSTGFISLCAGRSGAT